MVVFSPRPTPHAPAPNFLISLHEVAAVIFSSGPSSPLPYMPLRPFFFMLGEKRPLSSVPVSPAPVRTCTPVMATGFDSQEVFQSTRSFPSQTPMGTSALYNTSPALASGTPLVANTPAWTSAEQEIPIEREFGEDLMDEDPSHEDDPVAALFLLQEISNNQSRLEAHTLAGFEHLSNDNSSHRGEIRNLVSIVTNMAGMINLFCADVASLSASASGSPPTPPNPPPPALIRARMLPPHLPLPPRKPLPVTALP